MARFSFRNLFGGRQPQTDSIANTKDKPMSVVGVDTTTESIMAFDDSNITYTGDISDVDFDAILRDKQKNITTIYRLSDYFTDAHPIVHAINKQVYVPFESRDWFLTCPNHKTIDIYEEHYKKIRLRELIDDILLQFTKYENVFVYKWNGYAMTLPPHKCIIANLMLDGTPIVDFDVQSISYEHRTRSYSLLEQKGVKDETLEDILKGYPPEVAKAIREGKQYARLDPKNVFVLQGHKEGWNRYAIPWIVAAFPALAKTNLINKYESAMLNLGARSFIHATYGDTVKNQDILPDMEQLAAVKRIISSAMSNKPLAVTNHLVHVNPIIFDLQHLYDNPLYSQVNNEILSAGGIAGIIVNGDAQEGSTFASAQVSMQAAAHRIEAACHEVEEFMLNFNRSLAEDLKLVRTNNLKLIPEFHFKPLSMNGQKELREACEKLWNMGVVSTKTMMEAYGYSMENERKQREKEASDGTDEVLMPRDKMYEESQEETVSDDEKNPVGRPGMSDEERNSDPANAIRSKQAKDAADGLEEA